MRPGVIDVFRHGRNTLAALASNRIIARSVADALAHGAFADARRIVHTIRQRPDLGSEKVISRKYRFLFLCTPKAASRSLIAALRNADPEAEVVYHTPIGDVLAAYPEVEGYYSFAFIRHPFTRAFSWYWDMVFSRDVFARTYHPYRDKGDRSFYDPVAGRSVSFRLPLRELAAPSWKEAMTRRLYERFYGLAEASGFDGVCRWLNTPYGSDAFANRHFLSQHLQIRVGAGRLPDFIGSFENIDTDLNLVAERLRLPSPALPMLNTMAGWQATPDVLKAARSDAEVHLTEQNKALLRTRYASDLELWASHCRAGVAGDPSAV